MFKTYADTYIYRKADFESDIVKFIIDSKRVDKNNLTEIKNQLKKRQTSFEFIKLLDNKNVELLFGSKPLPKYFKVFVAKDIAENRQLKIFINVDDCYDEKDNTMNNVELFIAYLYSAHINNLYFNNHDLFTNHYSIVFQASSCYTTLFTNVIDYLYKISSTESKKTMCKYLISRFFNYNLLGKKLDDQRSIAIAKDISDITPLQEQSLIPMITEESFKNINTFIFTLSKGLKLDKLKTDNFIEKWLFLYGIDPLSIEYLPSFLTMLTNAYIGVYLNNQRTIEKLLNTEMVSLCRTLGSIELKL